jgi:sugar-specific transcriptional regulator TrmB
MDNTIAKAPALLGLNSNEETILSLIDNYGTPVELSKHCSIPRPTIYLTLDSLRKRGLVMRLRYKDKIQWRKSSDDYIGAQLQKVRNNLIRSSSKSQTNISISNNIQLSIHKGPKQIAKLLGNMVRNYPNERLIIISGNQVVDSWSKVLGLEKINAFNREIKELGVITEIVTSKKWFEEQTKQFGIEWAKNYEGRTTRVQNIDNKYLDYASQIFIIKNKVYLVSMPDEVFIEVKNAEIVKMLVSLTRFIQDNSSVFDSNALLRGLIEKSI